MAEQVLERRGVGERALHLACAGVTWTLLHPWRLPPLVTPGALGLSYERVQLDSQGVALAAWYVPREGARASLVLCHGRNNSRTHFTKMLRPLHEAGFNLLLFDFRCMGVSGGSVCTYGYQERGDALTAVEWLRANTDTERIGLYGMSLGGATTLLAAAADPQIGAVVTESAFASLDSMVEQNFFYLPPPARGPVGKSVRYWAQRWCGNRVQDVDPEAELRKWEPRPLLVIHGDRDLLIPVSHASRIVEAAGPAAELWTVPRAGHVGCLGKARGEYVQRVTEFFRTHLKGA